MRRLTATAVLEGVGRRGARLSRLERAETAQVTTDELADRIRSTVDGVLAPWPHMSVSVGAIRVRPGETSEAALDRADREMYADKQRSRSIRSAPRS